MLYFNLFRHAPGTRVLYKGPATQCHLGPAYGPFPANLLNASTPDIGQTLVLAFGVKYIRTP